jgi:large subunit ribosomal protein L14e
MSSLVRVRRIKSLPAVEVGRVCVKVTGREAGRKCVVVDVVNKNFALITGPKKVTGIKRRRVNVYHIEPTKIKVTIKRGATDEEIVQALTEAGELEEMSGAVKP